MKRKLLNSLFACLLLLVPLFFFIVVFFILLEDVPHSFVDLFSVFIKLLELKFILALVEDQTKFIVFKSVVSKAVLFLSWPFNWGRIQGIETQSNLAYKILEKVFDQRNEKFDQ